MSFNSNLMGSRNIFIIPVVLFLFPILLYAENSDSTLSLIEKNTVYFKKAANTFDVNPSFLKSIFYVERLLNYDWTDKVFDEFFAQSGRNSSIGFCQVKLKTAYWIENQLNDSASVYFPGIKYYKKLELSKSPQEIIDKLKQDSLNICYAAAYMRIIQSLWDKAGFPINDRLDIIATLYSTGLFKHDGSLRKPHKEPEANYFGKKAAESIYLFLKKRTH